MNSENLDWIYQQNMRIELPIVWFNCFGEISDEIIKNINIPFLTESIFVGVNFVIGKKQSRSRNRWPHDVS